MAQAPRGTAGLEECAEAATQLGQKILFHLSSRECKWSNKLLSAQVMLYKKVVMPESDTLCILEREAPAVASGRARDDLDRTINTKYFCSLFFVLGFRPLSSDLLSKIFVKHIEYDC